MDWETNINAWISFRSHFKIIQELDRLLQIHRSAVVCPFSAIRRFSTPMVLINLIPLFNGNPLVIEVGNLFFRDRSCQPGDPYVRYRKECHKPTNLT